MSILLLSASLSLAQNNKNPFPGELEGFRFFRSEKLRALKLGSSDRNHVARIFGSDCETPCDYGDSWQISFMYLGNGVRTVTVNGIATEYRPVEEFIGRLMGVKLIPKKTVRVDVKTLRSKFRLSGGGGVYSHDGKGGGASEFFRIYSNGAGLLYRIVEDFRTTETEKSGGESKLGDLLSIDYEISSELDRKFYGMQN